jgi:hypothetical protein
MEAPDAGLSQRLIESVGMVKELMQSNRELRDTIDGLSASNERNEADLYQLQVENRDLRDRIEILESVIASTTHQSDFDQLDWRQVLLQEKPRTGGSAVNEMATELIESKKANRQLSMEVEGLRAELDGLRSELESRQTTTTSFKSSASKDPAAIYAPKTKP